MQTGDTSLDQSLATAAYVGLCFHAISTTICTGSIVSAFEAMDAKLQIVDPGMGTVAEARSQVEIMLAEKEVPAVALSHKHSSYPDPAPNTSQPKLSVVSPVYHSGRNCEDWCVWVPLHCLCFPNVPCKIIRLVQCLNSVSHFIDIFLACCVASCIFTSTSLQLKPGPAMDTMCPSFPYAGCWAKGCSPDRTRFLC